MLQFFGSLKNWSTGGWLFDQSALLGVMNALYNLHLPVQSVEYVREWMILFLTMKYEKERAYARSGINYSFQGSTMKTHLPYLAVFEINGAKHTEKEPANNSIIKEINHE